MCGGKYIVLIGPTFAHNKTFRRLGEKDPRMIIFICEQQYTSITASFRENVAAVVLFYSPAARTMKSIIVDSAGELTPEEYKTLIARLKKQKYSYLVFSLRHPFGVELFSDE